MSRDKAWASRDKVGTSRDNEGTSRGKQGQAGPRRDTEYFLSSLVPCWRCLSLLVLFIVLANPNLARNQTVVLAVVRQDYSLLREVC